MAVYDAAPSHNGGRWAVAVAEPAAGPMTARVLWVAEADFQAALATAGKPVKP
jgi:hypothetical protein